MMKNTARRRLLAAAVLLAAAGATSAQTKLKWGHVYEASEPFHKCVSANSTIRQPSLSR